MFRYNLDGLKPKNTVDILPEILETQQEKEKPDGFPITN